ncbi:MAG: Gfo/Idh/MocA family oxidoreductase [Pirellulaceae bacterium]|nr:Gfo/Idh/MocA family oxidoreductase [Pirellulaceae bacterium]
MPQKVTRRRAIQSATAASVAFYHGATSRKVSAAESPNEKLNVACIGVGGQGAANVSKIKHQNIVALVDVDQVRGGKSFEQHPGAQRFVDYRKMLDQIGSKIDGVLISTPDHTHFHPAYAAMQLGLHVYLEKPLAHNVWETRKLCDYAKQKKLATQLGAQRHTKSNMHRVVELIQSGAIGKVNEVYSWVGSSRGMPAIPNDTPPVPKTLDYELWLGPVAGRPYHPSFCPYGWRFWWDFGTGETGNWGCHILDIPFWALGLRFPNRVDASGPDVDDDRTPKSMRCVYQFPTSNQNRPITLHWGQGTPPVIQEKGLSAKGNNTLFIGDNGMLLCGFDQRVLLPEENFRDFKAPEPFVPDSPGFHNEWINACKGGEAATCNFDYSGPMAETVLLGNVAYRAGGFDWDAKTLQTGSNAAAQALIQEPYRRGWEIQ